jgi:hypothetical protein
MHRTLVKATLALALAAGLAPSTYAVEPQHQNGITYLSGGIGDSGQKMMREHRSNYNLLLTFAAKQTGAYLADVKVEIMDAQGKQLLSVPNTGPMFFAKLQPGTYRISATSQGKTFKRSVKLDNAPKEMVLHWATDPQDDPGLQ